MRHTKIIATVGPASSDTAVLERLITSGVDVFRLNFSHGTPDTHGAVVQNIRAVSRRLDREVAILQDLSGPKIRTGKLQEGKPLILAAGDRLDIKIGSEIGRPGLVSTTYAPLADTLKPRDRLLLDDGKIELAVEQVSSGVISTRVVDGGALGEHKGINAPNVQLPAVGVTEKDANDLRFGLSAGVDLIALSFVQSADDIAKARTITADANRPKVPIVAKLERPEAINRLSEIVDAADAVMVARGDLGLEMPLERVPQVQKQVLLMARERGVPAIVATQVLESMRTEPRPTRAEVSDAAGAVDSGADAIMLSGETAVGEYPVRAAQVLDSIIRNAEALPPPWVLAVQRDERPDHLPPLCDAAVTLAARANVQGILAITRQGRTARLLSNRRPSAIIHAITDSEEVGRRLCLWWGVAPVLDPLTGGMEAIMERVATKLRHRNALPPSATVVVVSGSPRIHESMGNFLRIRVV